MVKNPGFGGLSGGVQCGVCAAGGKAPRGGPRIQILGTIATYTSLSFEDIASVARIIHSKLRSGRPSSGIEEVAIYDCFICGNEEIFNEDPRYILDSINRKLGPKKAADIFAE